MSLRDAASIAAVIGVLLALLGFLKGLVEYSRQGAQKRAEDFVELGSRLYRDPDFRHMCDLLEDDSPYLRDVSYQDKREFLGFFEELALMANSKLIKRRVAHYMFGYYALRCWQSQNFWIDIERQSIYWALFKDFAQQMEDVDRSFRYRRRDFRLYY